MQVTCKCRAYEFPHRCTGGKCTGSEWAESYYLTVRECCETCNCNNGYCEVAAGQESIEECEGYQDHLHYGSDIRLPRTEEEMIDGYRLRYEALGEMEGPD